MNEDSMREAAIHHQELAARLFREWPSIEDCEDWPIVMQQEEVAFMYRVARQFAGVVEPPRYRDRDMNVKFNGYTGLFAKLPAPTRMQWAPDPRSIFATAQGARLFAIMALQKLGGRVVFRPEDFDAAADIYLIESADPEVTGVDGQGLALWLEDKAKHVMSLQ